MKIHYIITVFFVISCGCLSGQSNCYISCDSLLINITASELEPLDLLKEKLHADYYLKFNHPFTDTLNFEVKLYFPIQALGVRNLCVNGFDEERDRVNDIKTENSGLSFKIIPNSKIKYLVLSYDIHGAAFLFFNDSASVNKLFVYHSDTENLIAYNPYTDIKKTVVKTSIKNTLAFSHFFDRNNKTDSCRSADRYGITVIDTTAFKHITNNLPNLKYNIYIQDTDYLKKFQKKEFNNALIHLLQHTAAQSNINIIATKYQSGNSKFGFGQAFGNHFYCDTSFLSAPVSLIHEAIHILYPINSQRNTAGEFFIGESLVEWLANYLIKRNFVLPDSISAAGNLLDVKINNQDTWKLIYYKGVYVLEQAAKKTSSDFLFNTIMSFFVEYRNKEVNFNDFCEFMKIKGCPAKVIKQLKIDLAK